MIASLDLEKMSDEEQRKLFLETFLGNKRNRHWSIFRLSIQKLGTCGGEPTGQLYLARIIGNY